MSSVHYKFKSNLQYDTVTFDGLHISLGDLKKEIMAQKHMGKSADYDLQITNAQTKQEYKDDSDLIPKNASVTVARVPVVKPLSKGPWDKRDSPSLSDFRPPEEDQVVVSFRQLTETADLSSAKASEQDKIQAMMLQSTNDYDPSNYVRTFPKKGMSGPPPAGYKCYKCLQAGHWIWNCTNTLKKGEEGKESSRGIKRSSGIPRSFMTTVSDPSVPGALLTGAGTYAVPKIDAEAYKIGKKERPPFVPKDEPEPEPEPEREIPPELSCVFCKDLLTDAVVIPCCGNSFCDECIRGTLLETEDHVCPSCKETDISPDSLIPNTRLRQAVENYKNETGYTKVKERMQKKKEEKLKREEELKKQFEEEEQERKAQQLTEKVVLVETRVPSTVQSNDIDISAGESIQTVSVVTKGAPMRQEFHTSHSKPTAGPHVGHSQSIPGRVTTVQPNIRAWPPFSYHQGKGSGTKHIRPQGPSHGEQHPASVANSQSQHSVASPHPQHVSPPRKQNDENTPIESSSSSHIDNNHSTSDRDESSGPTPVSHSESLISVSETGSPAVTEQPIPASKHRQVGDNRRPFLEQNGPSGRLQASRPPPEHHSLPPVHPTAVIGPPSHIRGPRPHGGPHFRPPVDFPHYPPPSMSYNYGEGMRPQMVSAPSDRPHSFSAEMSLGYRGERPSRFPVHTQFQPHVSGSPQYPVPAYPVQQHPPPTRLPSLLDPLPDRVHSEPPPPGVMPDEKPLSEEEFYREQKRLKDEEAKKSDPLADFERALRERKKQRQSSKSRSRSISKSSSSASPIRRTKSFSRSLSRSPQRSRSRSPRRRPRKYSPSRHLPPSRARSPRRRRTPSPSRYRKTSPRRFSPARLSPSRTDRRERPYSNDARNCDTYNYFYGSKHDTDYNRGDFDRYRSSRTPEPRYRRSLSRGRDGRDRRPPRDVDRTKSYADSKLVHDKENKENRSRYEGERRGRRDQEQHRSEKHENREFFVEGAKIHERHPYDMPEHEKNKQLRSADKEWDSYAHTVRVESKHDGEKAKSSSVYSPRSGQRKGSLEKERRVGNSGKDQNRSPAKKESDLKEKKSRQKLESEESDLRKKEKHKKDKKHKKKSSKEISLEEMPTEGKLNEVLDVNKAESVVEAEKGLPIRSIVGVSRNRPFSAASTRKTPFTTSSTFHSKDCHLTLLSPPLQDVSKSVANVHDTVKITGEANEVIHENNENHPERLVDKTLGDKAEKDSGVATVECLTSDSARILETNAPVKKESRNLFDIFSSDAEDNVQKKDDELKNHSSDVDLMDEKRFVNENVSASLIDKEDLKQSDSAQIADKEKTEVVKQIDSAEDEMNNSAVKQNDKIQILKQVSDVIVEENINIVTEEEVLKPEKVEPEQDVGKIADGVTDSVVASETVDSHMPKKFADSNEENKEKDDDHDVISSRCAEHFQTETDENKKELKLSKKERKALKKAKKEKKREEKLAKKRRKAAKESASEGSVSGPTGVPTNEREVFVARELSKWELEDEEIEKSQPSSPRVRREAIPSSVIERAEKYLIQKPRIASSVVVTSVQSSHTRHPPTPDFDEEADSYDRHVDDYWHAKGIAHRTSPEAPLESDHDRHKSGRYREVEEDLPRMDDNRSKRLRSAAYDSFENDRHSSTRERRASVPRRDDSHLIRDERRGERRAGEIDIRRSDITDAERHHRSRNVGESSRDDHLQHRRSDDIKLDRKSRDNSSRLRRDDSLDHVRDDRLRPVIRDEEIDRRLRIERNEREHRTREDRHDTRRTNHRGIRIDELGRSKHRYDSNDRGMLLDMDDCIDMRREDIFDGGDVGLQMVVQRSPVYVGNSDMLLDARPETIGGDLNFPHEIDQADFLRERKERFDFRRDLRRGKGDSVTDHRSSYRDNRRDSMRSDIHLDRTSTQRSPSNSNRDRSVQVRTDSRRVNIQHSIDREREVHDDRHDRSHLRSDTRKHKSDRVKDARTHDHRDRDRDVRRDGPRNETDPAHEIRLNIPRSDRAFLSRSGRNRADDGEKFLKEDDHVRENKDHRPALDDRRRDGRYRRDTSRGHSREDRNTTRVFRRVQDSRSPAHLASRESPTKRHLSVVRDSHDVSPSKRLKDSSNNRESSRAKRDKTRDICDDSQTYNKSHRTRSTDERRITAKEANVSRDNLKIEHKISYEKAKSKKIVEAFCDEETHERHSTKPNSEERKSKASSKRKSSIEDSKLDKRDKKKKEHKDADDRRLSTMHDETNFVPDYGDSTDEESDSEPPPPGTTPPVSSRPSQLSPSSHKRKRRSSVARTAQEAETGDDVDEEHQQKSNTSHDSDEDDGSGAVTKKKKKHKVTSVESSNESSSGETSSRKQKKHKKDRKRKKQKKEKRKSTK